MITCYAEPTKKKSQLVLEAFAAGCGARMGSTEARELEAGPAAFYGVRPGWRHLWEQAKAEGRDWWYLDNAFFDADRERKFRVSKNCVQQTEFRGIGQFRGNIAPWRRDGDHALICPQSAEFMECVAGWEGDWAEWVTGRLRQATARPVRVRRKGGRIALADDLRGAWAVVVHSSAAANEALLAGVPVFTTGACAAAVMGCSDLAQIETPRYPEARHRWAAGLAAAQWTLDELRDGTCWRHLNQKAGS